MSLAWSVIGLVVGLMLVALFFFVVTRGGLLWRTWTATYSDEKAHIYPVYANKYLMRCVDFQPIISAILLFQYGRIVSALEKDLHQYRFNQQQLLITSCAFGNVIPRIVDSAQQLEFKHVQIIDLIPDELIHVQQKLKQVSIPIDYQVANAVAMPQATESVAVNILFFLLHELPHPMKLQVLQEAGRVLAVGGKLYIAEFHRPRSAILRGLSRLYFRVFEPYAQPIWDEYDPVACLQRIGHWQCQRQTFGLGNYQLIVATKLSDY